MADLTVAQAIIGLCNPKSPANVGAVMRAAGCYGASKVVYTGERLDRALKFQTDTKNAARHIPLLATDSFIRYKNEGLKIICVEFAIGAQPLPEFVHPTQALYVFGPEDGSIDQVLLNQADAAVYIPTNGCMNIAASVNVVLYDRLAKTHLRIDHDQQVKHNRDVNNRLVFTPKNNR